MFPNAQAIYTLTLAITLAWSMHVHIDLRALDSKMASVPRVHCQAGCPAEASYLQEFVTSTTTSQPACGASASACGASASVCGASASVCGASASVCGASASESGASASESGASASESGENLEDPNYLLACYTHALHQLREQRVHKLRVKDIRRMFRVMCKHEHDEANRTDWFVPATGLTTGEFCFLQVAPLIDAQRRGDKAGGSNATRGINKQLQQQKTCAKRADHSNLQHVIE